MSGLAAEEASAEKTRAKCVLARKVLRRVRCQRFCGPAAAAPSTRWARKGSPRGELRVKRLQPVVAGERGVSPAAP